MLVGDTLPVLNHGYVKLLEIMGSDEAIVDAARISYDRRGKTADRSLIRYLLRHRHTSPFEMAEMRFELKMPIFVARQWVRHRTANMNEVSARYTELPDDFFVPDSFAVQSKSNKQGRDETLDDKIQGMLRRVVTENSERAYEDYKYLLDMGVAREIARGVLPVNIYTKFVWKMDLHNLMHFLHLRLHPHAQEEIREYAAVMEMLMAKHFPITAEAFRDYVRDSYTLSRMEIELLQKLLAVYQRYSQDGDDKQANVDIAEADREFGDQVSKRELADFRRVFLEGPSNE